VRRRQASARLDNPTDAIPPVGKPAERALTAFWQDPTSEHARDYLRVLLPVLRLMRKAESASSIDRVPPAPTAEPFPYGAYPLGELLGYGTEGVVYRAHRDGEQDVAVKLPARGDAIVACLLLVESDNLSDWPPQLLRTYEVGKWQDSMWIARELADETLYDYAPSGLSERRQVLEIFRVACEGVAWLHAHRIYGWSAHSQNVYRVGEQWKLGDFGRVWCFVPPDHAELGDWRDTRERFGLWTGTGVLPYDPDREHRLKLDDCAMLGGLLVQMLTGKRWGWFFRALNKRPYCSAVYPLTGDRVADRRLSAIVNRCWRGDAGGAPLLANGERGEQSTYADPLELLADVAATTNR